MIQTGTEELFYRGYLQQRIAVLIPHPAAWLILPNIAFALAHWSSAAPGIENAAYILWAFCFGLAASDLTARAGTLGPPPSRCIWPTTPTPSCSSPKDPHPTAALRWCSTPLPRIPSRRPTACWPPGYLATDASGAHLARRPTGDQTLAAG